MERILICPGERSTVAFLAQTVPLVTVPVLGESILTAWLGALACAGIKKVLVLATDRPDLVRAAVGDGSRWGVRVEVRAELRELTPAEVQANSTTHGAVDSVAAEVTLIDHLPDYPDRRLMRSYRDWFTTVLEWMPRAAKLNRIGLREIQPGVWCGRRARIPSTATLVGPCWLGDHVHLGANVVIGPEAVLEDRVVVDTAAEIESSLVGPDTYVGSLTKVKDSLAWGPTLIDWRTNSCTQVPDPFLLCALGQRYLPPLQRNGRGRVRSGRLAWLRRPWDLLWGLQSRLRS